MTEKRKQWLLILLPVLVCALGMAAASAFWLNGYRQSAFEQLSKFCEAAIQESPEAEVAVLSALKKYPALLADETGGDLFLAQYGYDGSQFCGGRGRQFLALSFGLGLLMAGCFGGSVWYLEAQTKRRIAELTRYLEHINFGAEGTAVQTREDAFSPLQDELYKTVTALYQTRAAAVKAKENFADNLANIAHQLKTPVAAASLSLQLMEKEAPAFRSGPLKKQLERLGTLEEALLTLSRLDAGTLSLEREEIDIYTALTLAADNLSDLLQKAGVSVSIPENGCVSMTGDMEWTMEALLNLMKNCMEHSPPGGTVHCEYSGNPLYASICIWDEGEGFCPEELPHLFERFYRGKRASPHGTGIGLPLAKSIFELENGAVTARTLPEGGACFEVRVYSH